jgi:hypothetical protein
VGNSALTRLFGRLIRYHKDPFHAATDSQKSAPPHVV